METEYTISNGSKIFNSIIGVFLIAFSLFLSYAPAIANKPLVLIVPLLLLIVGVLVVVNQFKARVVVNDYSIRKTNVFKKRELLFSEVKGIRISGKIVIIESIAGDKFRINNYSEFRGSDELVARLKDRFTDLDKVELNANNRIFMADAGFGLSEEERERKLKSARTTAVIYNLTGMPAGLGAIFLDNIPAMLICLVYPLIGIALLIFSGGLIKFLSKKTSVYPFIVLGLEIPVLVIFFKATMSFDILEYNQALLPAAVVAVIIFFIIYKTGINKQAGILKAQVILMIVFACLYGYGSIVNINCEFDNTKVSVTYTKIFSKYTEYHKRTHYYFKLISWDKGQGTRDIEVSQTRYVKYAQGDDIEVYLRKGLFNIPWFTLYN